MTLSIPEMVVVFDYGEVISLSQTPAAKERIRALAGVSDAEFWPAYWEHRDDLDRGAIPIIEYWARVSVSAGTEFSSARVQELWVADFTSWISVNPDTFEIIEELYLGGARLVLLSNAGYDFGSVFRYAPIAGYFDRIFISAEMGRLKPEADIFETIIDELGVAPEAMIFIDNKLGNVHGAEAVGIRGHHFVGAAELRSFLTTFAV
jgi:putative hydrolase of the HAD superfamily